MRLMSTMCAVAVAATAIAATPDAFAQRRGQAASVVVVNYQRVLAESSLGRDLATKLNQVRTQVSRRGSSAPAGGAKRRAGSAPLAAISAQPEPAAASPTTPRSRPWRSVKTVAGSARLRCRATLSAPQLIALRDVRNQIMPIVRAVMQQRNAGLVLDSSQALEVTTDYDITTTVIQQLDQNAATRTAKCQPPACRGVRTASGPGDRSVIRTVT